MAGAGWALCSLPAQTSAILWFRPCNSLKTPRRLLRALTQRWEARVCLLYPCNLGKLLQCISAKRVKTECKIKINHHSLLWNCPILGGIFCFIRFSNQKVGLDVLHQLPDWNIYFNWYHISSFPPSQRVLAPVCVDFLLHLPHSPLHCQESGWWQWCSQQCLQGAGLFLHHRNCCLCLWISHHPGTGGSCKSLLIFILRHPLLDIISNPAFISFWCCLQVKRIHWNLKIKKQNSHDWKVFSWFFSSPGFSPTQDNISTSCLPVSWLFASFFLLECLNSPLRMLQIWELLGVKRPNFQSCKAFPKLGSLKSWGNSECFPLCFLLSMVRFWSHLCEKQRIPSVPATQGSFTESCFPLHFGALALNLFVINSPDIFILELWPGSSTTTTRGNSLSCILRANVAYLCKLLVLMKKKKTKQKAVYF